MSSKNEKKKGVADGTQNTAPEGVPTHQPTGLGAVAGEIVGAVVGCAAGPVGAVAGMVLGGLAGEVVSDAFQWEAERARRHEQELDETIGTIGGDIGAALPGSPPARKGAPSPDSA